MSTTARRAACRHANQDRDACMDCGRVWPDPRHRALSRTEEHRLRMELLVLLLRDQDADGRALWADARGLILRLAAERERERVATGALERVMDQLVDFDSRCAAGDEAGAVLALRSWLARL